MSRTLFRTAVLAAALPVLGAALVMAAPAASATHIPPPPQCATATPFVDFDVQGSPTTITVEPVTSTQTNICLRSMDFFDLVLVVNSNVAFVEPDADLGGGQFACSATPFFEARQPVALTISYSIGGASTLCLEINGVATTLTLASLPSVTAIPSFQLWTNGDTFIDRFVFCGLAYADYVQDNSLYYQWVGCYSPTRRLI
jgi:hypothetical protein